MITVPEHESTSVADVLFFFFFKQKTAYEIRSCDWSSDVCSSDLYVYARVCFSCMLSFSLSLSLEVYCICLYMFVSVHAVAGRARARALCVCVCIYT